jgi:hypothetical protein
MQGRIKTLLACSAYSSTLKMEAQYLSKTSVNFYHSILQHIPEHTILYVYHKMSYSSTLKTETVYSSERSVNFYLIIWRDTPECSILHVYHKISSTTILNKNNVLLSTVPDHGWTQA